MRRSLLVLFLLALTGAAHAQAPQRPIAPQRRTVGRQPVFRVQPSPAPRPSPSPQPAPQPAPGRVRCEALENGAAAQATIELRRGNDLVASGSCASPIEVPAGTYDATLTLETAMDRPTQRVSITVPANGEATARASFETAILEVRFTYQRQATSGLAVIRRGGREVGTLGSGVTARLSPGTYEVVARHRTSERTHTVTLAAGARRALRADF